MGGVHGRCEWEGLYRRYGWEVCMVGVHGRYEWEVWLGGVHGRMRHSPPDRALSFASTPSARRQSLLAPRDISSPLWLLAACFAA